MDEPKKPIRDMTPDERRAYVEALLAKAREDPMYKRFRESMERCRRITQKDLDFRVR